MTEGVALTFDDGPDPHGTPDVLAALAAIDAHASFFVMGERAAAHPELVRATVAAGHEVELHCHRHRRHGTLARAEAEDDADRALAELARQGVRPRRWRTPWGDLAPWSADVAARRGLALTGWSADSEDWRGDRHEAMLERLDDSLVPGAVVLMHDGVGPGALRDDCRETAALLAPLAARARERGLALGPLPAPARR